MPPTSCDALTIVFAKAPRAGEVKTRLIPALGAEGAASLHRQLLHRTLVTATNAGLGPVELHCAPGIEDAFLKDCARRYGVALAPQNGRDLGARMCHAFEEALARHARVILVGTDCPVLTEQHLRDANAALDPAQPTPTIPGGNDAVLIPAEDGGYALIGLRQCDTRLFDGIAWGGDTVLAATRARLKLLGWRWHELETLWDIDRPEDYRRWSEQLIHDASARLA